MQLYKADGEIWEPHEAEPHELDILLRRIVDAIRYQRRSLYDLDSYDKAVTRLTEATIEYAAARRWSPVVIHGEGSSDRKAV